jgi:hypothetical protein
MALMPEPALDLNKPLVVRRFFVAAGRHLNPGDPFEWRRWAIDQRRVRQLFDAGKIMHGTATLASAEPVTPAPSAPSTAPSITQEVQDDDIHHVAVTAPATDEPPATAEQVTGDGLDDLGMKELREIASQENAPFRVSREAQREAIRDARRARAAE